MASRDFVYTISNDKYAFSFRCFANLLVKRKAKDFLDAIHGENVDYGVRFTLTEDAETIQIESTGGAFDILDASLPIHAVCCLANYGKCCTKQGNLF